MKISASIHKLGKDLIVDVCDYDFKFGLGVKVRAFENGILLDRVKILIEESSEDFTKINSLSLKERLELGLEIYNSTRCDSYFGNRINVGLELIVGFNEV
ncbi:hypothetical protein [Pseudoalteromonas sp. H105]|uniref:hypothetical protein n=1 Tax=Pseudoalteromonas sp. H105 TaxID=1348393 RepID=UPI0007323DB9|nr:hypothetical protein [Pseudoalteromonas sp. H105]KTF16039.1 hypothetical protein ATS75_06445 [Pseudoalteromonas sp. H105]